MSIGITLNGTYYAASQLSQFVECATSQEESLYYQEIADFLEDWWSPKSVLLVRTSGSTGAPKPLWVKKSHMENSARLTCQHLKLKQGDPVLLCMSVRYIAGKMMLVRALVSQLAVWVVPPKGRPLAQFDSKLVFAAMVPLQVYNSLKNPVDMARLQAVRHLLIGGGAIDQDMAEQLARFPNQVYSSYGMTETVSHIALRQLSGSHQSAWYYPLPSVCLSQTHEGALVIDAPLVSSEQLVTHDVVRMNSRGGFQLVGRLDHIINSGGVKLQPEQIEQKLKSYISYPFVITSRKDKKLGEALVLLIESESFYVAELNTQINQVLSTYERPKAICFVAKLPRTETEKIRRPKCKELANRLCMNK